MKFKICNESHLEMCLSLDAVVDSLLSWCLDCSVLVPTPLEDRGQKGGEKGVRGGRERSTHFTRCHTSHHLRNGSFPAWRGESI